MFDALRDFFRLEAASGIVLVLAAAVAMVVANSGLHEAYAALLAWPVPVPLGRLSFEAPLLLVVNDALMVLFFLVVGLELKREIQEGELASRDRIALPAIGALGGMIVPALVFVLLNRHDSHALRGWAIPTATDIAFALGVLSLLGQRVPLGLKVFLVSLAIFDDLGAILIIAGFYTSALSWPALAVVALCLGILWLLNRAGVTALAAYSLVGLLMWAALLKSGIHATLAGVMLALFIPLRDPARPDHSPLRWLEHSLHTFVAYAVLPLFAFFNAGVSLHGGVGALLQPVPLGIALGLLFGKQAGVMLACWLGTRLGVARLPAGIGWAAMYGAAILCGIGFTMSLFIASLAYENPAQASDRLGILAGSLLSAVIGYLFLKKVLPAA